MATDVEIVSGVTEKILTHEVGAGAPCLKCGDKCPGLDLHFWRKICRNCKCKQEDHDVQSSVSTRGIQNIGKLLMQDSETTTNTTNQSPEKAAAPPPAPKPVKHTSPPAAAAAPAPVTNYNAAPPFDKDLNVTIDIGGQKHTLDFGSAAHERQNPPQPAQDNDASYPEPPAAEELPPPPADLVEAPPAVPPLPEEFTEKVVVAGSPEKKLEPIENDTKPEANATMPGRTTTPASNDEEGLREYEWTPPVKDENLANRYIAQLPEDKQPIVGSAGAKYRKKQLMRQLPPHDQEPAECHDLTPQETQEMQLFVKKYREKALGGGKVDENSKNKSCAECHEALQVGDVIVWAERAGREKYWHPRCFCCAECKELLVDLVYFYHDDKIYCGRHYCELHKPRCAACDELIFAPEYTQAEDCYWHLKHFCCWHCDQPLGGKNYVPHDNQPVCIPCYEKSFAHSCSTCKQIIAPNTEWVTFEEFHWHAQPECFKCTQCGKSLVGKPCIPKGEMVFCCSQCKRAKIPAGQ